MLLPAGCWLQAAESPKKPLTIGQGKLTSCFAGWQAVRRMPPKRHKAVELRKASAGRLVQEISAVFVAAPLRVLELLFFSCLPVCPCHAV